MRLRAVTQRPRRRRAPGVSTASRGGARADLVSLPCFLGAGHPARQQPAGHPGSRPTPPTRIWRRITVATQPSKEPATRAQSRASAPASVLKTRRAGMMTPVHASATHVQSVIALTSRSCSTKVVSRSWTDCRRPGKEARADWEAPREALTAIKLPVASERLPSILCCASGLVAGATTL